MKKFLKNSWEFWRVAPWPLQLQVYSSLAAIWCASWSWFGHLHGPDWPWRFCMLVNVSTGIIEFRRARAWKRKFKEDRAMLDFWAQEAEAALERVRAAEKSATDYDFHELEGAASAHRLACLRYVREAHRIYPHLKNK